jgi:hypothetical protein
VESALDQPFPLLNGQAIHDVARAKKAITLSLTMESTGRYDWQSLVMAKQAGYIFASFA